METPTGTRNLASLVLDETLHPRHAISNYNIAQLTEALRAGEILPPVLIDNKSGKVIDGFHRIHAFERVFGPDFNVPVIEKSYRSKRAMLEDAIAANVGRGQDLTRWDHTRCIELAEEVGMSLNTLAKLLKWRPEKLAEYRESRTGTTLEGNRVALKRSLRHHLNRPLTPAQQEVNKHASGMAPLFHINQLISLLEADLMPPNEQTVERLAHLGELIESWLGGATVAS